MNNEKKYEDKKQKYFQWKTESRKHCARVFYPFKRYAHVFKYIFMGIGELGKITRINFSQKIYIFILKIKCYLKCLFIYLENADCLSHCCYVRIEIPLV